MKNFVISIFCLICLFSILCGCASNTVATEEPVVASAEIASDEIDTSVSNEASNEASAEASDEASMEIADIPSPTNMDGVGLG